MYGLVLYELDPPQYLNKTYSLKIKTAAVIKVCSYFKTVYSAKECKKLDYLVLEYLCRFFLSVFLCQVKLASNGYFDSD